MGGNHPEQRKTQNSGEVQSPVVLPPPVQSKPTLPPRPAKTPSAASAELALHTKQINEEIAQRKALGWNAQVDPGVYLSRSLEGTPLSEQIIKAFEKKKLVVGLMDGGIDRSMVVNSNCPTLPAAAETNSRYSIYPLSIQTAKTPDSRALMVRCWDHLLSNEVFNARVPLSKDLISATDAAVLANRVSKYLAENKESGSFQAVIAAVPPDRSFAKENTLALGERNDAAGRKLAELGRVLSAKSEPDGGFIVLEAAGRRQEADWYSRVLLQPEDLRRFGDRPLVVRGVISEITIVVPGAELPAGVPKGWSLTLADNQAGITAKVGNSVVVVNDDRGADGSPNAARVKVFPAPIFLDERRNAPVLAPVELDLRVLGKENFSTVIYQEALQPHYAAGQLKFYTTMNPETLFPPNMAQMSSIVSGVRKAEELFGLSARPVTKHVLILDARSQNALFVGTAPSSIRMYDEILKQKGAVQAVALHETAHLIDNATGHELSKGSLDILHATLRKRNPSFFKQLNEENFLPSGFGGHSQDNSKELVASLVNSLTHPRLGDKLRSMPAEFKDSYAAALEALRPGLNRAQIAKDAPIRGAIEKALTFLE